MTRGQKLGLIALGAVLLAPVLMASGASGGPFVQSIIAAFRKVFKINTEQVASIEALAAAWEKYGDGDQRKFLYLLCLSWHECRLRSIPEKRSAPGTTIWDEYQVNYWSSGYYGRGYPQLTWKDNYRKMGEIIGVDLVGNPDLALVPKYSAQIMVIGMTRGSFTGKRLSDYINAKGADYYNARRTIGAIWVADVDTAALIVSYLGRITAAMKAGISGCGCGCPSHVGAIYSDVPKIYACHDGTYSTSSGSRACSRHGGRKSDQPLTLQSGGSGLLNIQDVPLSAIHVDTKLFQGREKEFAERSVMNIVNDVVKGQFVWENLDPITLWRSPEGKLFLLSGHSRQEAFKRLSAAGYTVDGKGFERIPAKIYQGATADTAKRIALESNTLSTKETDIERAAYYRKLRQNGADEKTLLATIKKNEARNWTNIYAYTFLSPTGRTWAALQQLGEGEDTSATLAKSLARWIGQARRGWPALTNEHEAELYAWLFDRRGYGTGPAQVSSEREFLEKVALFIQKNTFFGTFDASKPLNILGAMQKSPAEAEHDAQIAQRQKQIVETERIIRDEIKRLTAARATKADLQRIVAPYETSLRNLRADLQRLILKKSEIVEYSKREAQLFGIRRPAGRIA